MAAGLPFTATVLTGAAFIGTVVGVWPALTATPGASPAASSYGEPLTGCTVTDGDTIRCGGERIRLLGIDAAELPGHCRTGRICVDGDPYAATASLQQAMAGHLTIDRVGTDVYDRTLARVSGDAGDLSCWQLSHGQAVYKPGWDDGLRVARTCPKAIG